jgi:cellulose synthase/poly-beta-1,6-N-acetylglucosamine synthase-like glycosyltransferase
MWFIASIIFLDPWHMFTCVSLDPSMSEPDIS